MEIIGRGLHLAAGIGHCRVDVGALGLGHGGEDVDALTDRVGKAQIDLHQVLVEVRELIIEVDQVLILGTCTQYGRRELLSAVGGIVPGELQAAVIDVVQDIVDVIHGDQILEIVDQPQQHRDVLIGIESGLAAILIALGVAAGLAVEPHHGVALRLILLRELRHILRHQLTVLFRLVGKLDGFIIGLLGDFIVSQELLEVVAIGYIVEIPVLFPLLHHIDFFCIALDVGVVGISGEDQIPVQRRIDHHHDNSYNNDDGTDAAQDTG